MNDSTILKKSIEDVVTLSDYEVNEIISDVRNFTLIGNESDYNEFVKYVKSVQTKVQEIKSTLISEFDNISISEYNNIQKCVELLIKFVTELRKTNYIKDFWGIEDRRWSESRKSEAIQLYESITNYFDKIKIFLANKEMPHLSVNAFLIKDEIQRSSQQVKSKIIDEIYETSQSVLRDIKKQKDELTIAYQSNQMKASNSNIVDAKKKTTCPLWIFGFISFVALYAVLCLIWHSYVNIDTTFDYVVKHFNKEQIELQKMYLIKNSLITLSAIALLSGIFTYSLKMVKSYLNIRTVYNHKIALLSSFENLVGKEILNSQERHTITETLIKQIISGDNISLGDNQSSAPSIVQSIIEKLPSSDKPN